MGITNIEWADYTLNPWRGCQKVSPGCRHCYAESRSQRWKEDFSGRRIVLADNGWQMPGRWDRDAAQQEKRARVFCASLADVFEDWSGPMTHHGGLYLNRTTDGWCLDNEVDEAKAVRISDVRDRLFQEQIDWTPNLDWLLLTKRPQNIRRFWPMMKGRKPIFPGAPGRLGEPLPCFTRNAYRPNVWLGTSVENQRQAEKRIPELLKCHELAPVLFLSCEPLLGPIDLRPWIDELSWVIVGGESGPNARPCYLKWIEQIVEQCMDTDACCTPTAVFVKQVGTNPFVRDGYPLPIDDRKGGNAAEWPSEIQIRQFPTVTTEASGG